MTIAISLKVNDGVVLAADSALTISMRDTKGATRVYYNAHKVFKLSDEPSTGMVTVGCGSIGSLSIAAIITDLMIASEGTLRNQSIEFIANSFRINIEPLYKKFYAGWTTAEPLTCIVGGYCPVESLFRRYIFTINNYDSGIFEELTDEYSMYYEGQTEAIKRLLNGYSPDLREILSLKFNPVDLNECMNTIKNALNSKLIVALMPIHDAIDLVRFLIQTEINYAKFGRGPQTVGGPIEIAAITKHDGFKWIQRNEHYIEELNKEDCV
jgi:hypothetical protein